MSSIPVSGRPDYSQFRDSIKVPYTNRPIGQTTPAIDVRINGSLVKNVALDSGSTVFAIGQDLVPGFPKDPTGLPTGMVKYSGDTVWTGYWYSIDVTISEHNGKSVTAAVCALVVTEQTHKGVPTHEPVHYMGIGFGILDPTKGWTPEKNALLCITQYDGKPVDNSTFRLGYIMGGNSIIIGLTGEDTEAFEYTHLSAGANTEQKYYWNRIGLALKLNDGPWIPGDGLIDSGLNYMIIDDPQKTDASTDLPARTDVRIKFSSENNNFPGFGFEWLGPGNGREPWIPASIQYGKSINTQSFVNTGRSLLTIFDTLFDPVEGWWGLRNSMP